MVGLVGALAGYDGSFEFASGSEYPANVPYVAMRVMLAMFGVGMVPLGWFTAVELGMSQWACHLVALMVLFGEFYFRHDVCEADVDVDRRRLALYLSVHSPGFNAPLLHIPNRLLPC